MHRKGHSRRNKAHSVVAAEVQTLEARQMLSSVPVWISPAEVANLPTTGEAWTTLLAEAKKTGDAPKISDQNSNSDVRTLARALVGVRLNDPVLIARAMSDISNAIGTEKGARTLAVGRNLPAYIAAAGVLDLQTRNPTLDAKFRTWLASFKTQKFDGETLAQTHERRPNNWGTHAGAARTAIALYLNDGNELARSVEVFRGWLGDRGVYSGFSYGDLSWQSDPAKPVGINPVGATIKGHSVDGALPEELRRAGGFRYPFPKENYQWESLQGAVAQAEFLYKAGYKDVYAWSDQALKRAVNFLYQRVQFPAEGDDRWIVWIINKRYGTAFPTYQTANAGKNMGWSSWTHAK